MQALEVYAGPAALRHLRERGLRPEDVRIVPGAAGGPKGLVLHAIDKFLFGEWLAGSSHIVHLPGASIGAWRMATAALRSPAQGFDRLAHDYIHQDYEIEPGRKSPTAEHVSARFAASLDDFFGARIDEVLQHPRYRLHVFTSRGRHVLGREGRLRTPAGYLGAFVANTASRRAMSAWLERVIFSDRRDALPIRLHDYRTRVVHLGAGNFRAAVQASCSIPFVLRAVHDIAGAPRGAYWDGGITDYHLHLDYASMRDGLVLYPHFQRQVVPGWLDKGLKWRHRATPFLDNVIVLAPGREWIKTLPNGKLPDRSDFARYGTDLASRVRDWTRAVAESARLADDWAQWLARQQWDAVKPL
jgi:hypothetical protein